MKNVLDYIKDLEAIGFSHTNTEVHINLIDILEAKFATKEDIRQLTKRVDRLEEKFAQLEHKVIIKLGILILVVNGLAKYL